MVSCEWFWKVTQLIARMGERESTIEHDQNMVLLLLEVLTVPYGQKTYGTLPYRSNKTNRTIFYRLTVILIPG